ncbi:MULTISPECIES: hypothetical protein [unclassified Roseivivax]|uniref:hypothetical protein n=1 Tax=unclassified Roseivivax TaxID=2639302 RepID=UPI00126809F9|nr:MULTISPECIES: hypothetical protein [unclassified Roseivivax]
MSFDMSTFPCAVDVEEVSAGAIGSRLFAQYDVFVGMALAGRIKPVGGLGHAENPRHPGWSVTGPTTLFVQPLK